MNYCKYCNEPLTEEVYRCSKCGKSQLENYISHNSRENNSSTWARLNKKRSSVGYFPAIYLFLAVSIDLIVYLYFNHDRLKHYSSNPYYGLFEYIATAIISTGFSVCGIVVGSKLTKIYKSYYLIVIPCWLVSGLNSVFLFLALPYVLVGFFATVPSVIVSSLLIWHSTRIKVQKSNI